MSIAGYAGWPAYDTFLIVLLSSWPVYDPNPLRPNPNLKKSVSGSCRVRGLARTLTPLAIDTNIHQEKKKKKAFPYIKVVWFRVLYYLFQEFNIPFKPFLISQPGFLKQWTKDVTKLESVPWNPMGELGRYSILAFLNVVRKFIHSVLSHT